MITVYDMTSGTLQKEHEAVGKETTQDTAGIQFEPMVMPALQIHEEVSCDTSQEIIPASMVLVDCGRFVEGMK